MIAKLSLRIYPPSHLNIISYFHACAFDCWTAWALMTLVHNDYCRTSSRSHCLKIDTSKWDNMNSLLKRTRARESLFHSSTTCLCGRDIFAYRCYVEGLKLDDRRWERRKHRGLRQERMLQSLGWRDSLGWVQLERPAQQIDEILRQPQLIV